MLGGEDGLGHGVGIPRTPRQNDEAGNPFPGHRKLEPMLKGIKRNAGGLVLDSEEILRTCASSVLKKRTLLAWRISCKSRVSCISCSTRESAHAQDETRRTCIDAGDLSSCICSGISSSEIMLATGELGTPTDSNERVGRNESAVGIRQWQMRRCFTQNQSDYD